MQLCFRRVSLFSLGIAALLCGFFVVSVSGQETVFETTFQQGVQAMHARRWDDAAQSFTQAVKLRPDFAEAYFNLGLVQLQQKQWAESSQSLRHALKLRPGLHGANMFAGIASYRRNDYAGAISLLKKETLLDAKNANAYMWLGVAELAAGKVEDAGESLDKAAKLKPNDVDILYHRGRAHMLISKDSYEQMYKAEPNSWRVHEVLAQSFTDAERYGDAINEGEEAIRLKPNEPGLHEELADIYWKQNQLDKAEAEFQNELKQDPENLTAMYKLSVVSIERSKPEVAAQLLGEVLQQEPHSADAHYQLGRAQAQMGNSESAIHSFQAAVSDSSQNDTETLRQSYYQLAQLYRRAQRPQESREALNSFMRLKQQADAEQAQRLQDKLKRSSQIQDSTQ
jgi:tetratricopeptide (TPR) repeat protein